MNPPFRRTLVLDGSPSPAGNSMRLALAMLEVIGGEADVIRLYEVSFSPCRNCGACAAGYACVLKDGLDGWWKRLEEADFLLLVSPIHFSSLSAPLVAFISRLQPFWLARSRGVELLPVRPGRAALAAAGGSDYPGMFAPARSVAMAACKSLGIPFAGMASVSGTDRRPAAENPAALAAAARLAGDVVGAPRKSGWARRP
ncbi:MAG: flavodoxin family protein [Planctomycetota bacterium]|nr:flavodoxin family protein [Planctomycetota bacterium]